jgi:signal transduction histidine kinase
MEVELLDLNKLVSDLLIMLRRLIGEHIKVCFNSRDDLTAVEADAVMIEQVIMNLSVNARHAMPCHAKWWKSHD